MHCQLNTGQGDAIRVGQTYFAQNKNSPSKSIDPFQEDAQLAARSTAAMLGATLHGF